MLHLFDFISSGLTNGNFGKEIFSMDFYLLSNNSVPINSDLIKRYN